MAELRIGTCSWNYASWLGLVYTRVCNTAAEYLVEYSRKYRTAEIDSWFYRLPSERDVEDYRAAVDGDFRFTCKAPQELTLCLLRGKVPLQNPSFLSSDLFLRFYERLVPIKSSISAIMLEFEYLNRQKMGGVGEFMERLGTFIASIPRDIPIAVECRNGNYLTKEYFAFLKDRDLIHVFSEKQYMPPIVSVYETCRDDLVESAIIRLLGGDRKDIEEATGERWDRIVDEKPAKADVVRMVKNLLVQGKRVVVNVNNHYEGSAPLTIESLLGMIGDNKEKGRLEK